MAVAVTGPRCILRFLERGRKGAGHRQKPQVKEQLRDRGPEGPS